MTPSPFAFMRGAAIVIAHDLASTPKTGIRAQLCGDAHLLNFGVCASVDPSMDAYSDPSTASASSRFTRWKSRTRPPLWIAGKRHRNAESSVSSFPYPFFVSRICKPY